MAAMSVYPELFLLFLLMVYLIYLVSRRGKTKSEPTNWPLVGMLPAALHNLHRGHDYITEVLTQCSGATLEFKGPWFCNLDMFFTSDPAIIHHILSKRFSNYPKGPEFRKIFEIFGDGFLCTDFELWEIHKKTILSYLTHANFSTSLEASVWNKVETGLLPLLDYFCELGTDFDLQEILLRFSFDVICKLVLGYDPCSLSVEMPYIPCEKAFSELDEPLFLRHIIPESIWKLQKWLKIGGEKKIMDAWEALDEFIYAHISKGEQAENDFSLLKTYDKVYKEEKIGSPEGLRVFLRDTLLGVMFAGRDTTSTCLTWLFWIARNPSTEIKIREEIEAQLHPKQDNKWRIMFDVKESRKLIYLHGALCESLRLFPPGALEYKSPIQADVLPNGSRLCKDAKVIISVYTVGRMESVWGKDCLEFKPERWISDKGRIKHEPSYKFPAFNAGPRTCPGKEMAFVQMKMVAATIIYHYNIQLVESHPVSPRASIILRATHGLKVRLSKRINLP